MSKLLQEIIENILLKTDYKTLSATRVLQSKYIQKKDTI